MQLIFFLLILPTFALTQTVVKGIVKDIRDNPLPFTNIVLLHQNKGTITNDKGEFELNNISPNDTVKVTNVAYQPKLIPISTILSNEKIVLLDSIKELSEVVVRNFNQFRNKKMLGYYKSSKNGEFKLNPGNQIALFIDNPIQKEGWIKSVKFRIKDLGKCKNSLRLRLLAVDSTLHLPTFDIIDENIIVKSGDLSTNNTIDLSPYKLILPKNGVYVLIEWLFPDNYCKSNSYVSIEANLETPFNLVCFNFRDGKWAHSNRPRLPNGNFMTPNIGLEVAF